MVHVAWFTEAPFLELYPVFSEVRSFGYYEVRCIWYTLHFLLRNSADWYLQFADELLVMCPRSFSSLSPGLGQQQTRRACWGHFLPRVSSEVQWYWPSVRCLWSWPKQAVFRLRLLVKVVPCKHNKQFVLSAVSVFCAWCDFYIRAVPHIKCSDHLCLSFIRSSISCVFCFVCVGGQAVQSVDI
jgi:hypothetical protein